MDKNITFDTITLLDVIYRFYYAVLYIILALLFSQTLAFIARNNRN